MYIAMNGPLKAILVRIQKIKRRVIESPSLLREYLTCHEQNVSINMDGNGHSDAVLD